MRWLLFTAAIVIIALSIYFFSSKPCLPPDKPSGVPLVAVWKGDCDGGDWIECVSITNNTARFRFYRDGSGELYLDSDFKNVRCQSQFISYENWQVCVAGYINERIEFMAGCGQSPSCIMVPVKPAYYDADAK
jgi:hypothetical protein